MMATKIETSRVAPAGNSGGDFLLRLIVRGATDVARLKAASKTVRRLPESGIRVLIDGLPPDAAARLESRTRRYIRACGCAEGATAALLILVAMAAYRGLEIGTRGWRADDALFAVAAVIAAGLGMAAAKFAAIGIARRRFERTCDDTIALIERQAARKGEA